MKIGIIGLGRVGLPIALVLASHGHKVFGVDKNVALLQKLRNKEAPFLEPGMEELIDCYMNERVEVSDSISYAVKNSDIVLITIGTYISANNVPLIDNIYELVNEFRSQELRGKLIIFKTTLPLGSTMRLKEFLEEKSGLKCGVDFWVAYSPERMVEGRAIEETETLPNIVGGVDETSQKKTVEFCKAIGNKVAVVENSTAAEFVKLIDNSYRSTIFAFANDVALLAEKYGLNATELIKSANSNYPRNNIPLPSCGVSGYCLTKDPLYLESSFGSIENKRGFPSIWFSGRKINDYMPTHTVNLVEEALHKCNKVLEGTKVLLCGLTYKENVDDIRQSHGIEIAKELELKGADVYVYDPWLGGEVNLEFKLCGEADKAFRGKDVVIFTVKHRQFIEWKGEKLKQLMSYMKTTILIDGWNIFPELAKDNQVNYKGIGTG